jgi:hypothetical protein
MSGLIKAIAAIPIKIKIEHNVVVNLPRDFLIGVMISIGYSIGPSGVPKLATRQTRLLTHENNLEHKENIVKKMSFFPKETLVPSGNFLATLCCENPRSVLLISQSPSDRLLVWWNGWRIGAAFEAEDNSGKDFFI